MSGMSLSTLYASIGLKIIFYRQVKCLYNGHSKAYLHQGWLAYPSSYPSARISRRVPPSTCRSFGLAKQPQRWLNLACLFYWLIPIPLYIMTLAFSHCPFFRICPRFQRSTPTAKAWASVSLARTGEGQRLPHL